MEPWDIGACSNGKGTKRNIFFPELYVRTTQHSFLIFEYRIFFLFAKTM